jgi:hypothetical protein
MHFIAEMVWWAVVEHGNGQWNGSRGDSDFGEADIFAVGIRWNWGVAEEARVVL